MGLIKAVMGATGGVLADQWKEYIYGEEMPPEILVSKGKKRTSGRSSNTSAEDNIITNGSVVAVNEGQCMMIVEQGKIVEVSAEPGEFVYDSSTEPSIFAGELKETVVSVFKNIGKRFTFGGGAGKDQRVYYFNTKEIMGNKYGTPSPIPFRVVDERAGIDFDITIRCFGEYSYKLTNPLLFYTNVCGNVDDVYERETIDGQLKTELLTSLQSAFAKISEAGIRYSALPGHTDELVKILNEVLSGKWRDLRGIEIVSFGISSVKADEKAEERILSMQQRAAFTNPTLAAAQLVGAQAEAMTLAASNEGGGSPALAFMGMNMAGMAGGMNPGNLYAMGQQQQMAQQQMAQPQMAQQQGGGVAPMGQAGAAQQPAGGWTCTCGQGGNQGKFCSNCGSPQPPPKTVEGWTCACGQMNKGNFCSACGAKRPAGAPLYRCDKCGWQPDDPHHPPKFCPECGDPFDDNDKA